MKVSVLVPIYNVEKYLRQCLQSICEQTLPDIEILCINDGSTDSSRNIIEAFHQKDSRVKLINKVNTGYGNSMNVGLDHASGEYVAIVESDDFIEPDMLERLYSTAEKYQTDIVKSNYYSYSENNGEERNVYTKIYEEIEVNKEFCPLSKPQLFWGTQAIWSALYRRAFLVSNNIRFNETPGASYQDISFAFQTYACAESAVLISDAFYHYRIDNTNSSMKAPDKVFSVCDELQKIDTFISERGKCEEQLRIIASRLGYRILLENYQRVAGMYQYAVLLRMVEYFQAYKDAGYLKGEIWEQDAVEQAERILYNPQKYFQATSKAIRKDRLMCSDLCINNEVYKKAVFEKILSSKSVLLYGAGKIGKKVLAYLTERNYPRENIFFAVTSVQKNASTVEGIPVHELEYYWDQKDEMTVVLSAAEQAQIDMAERLQERGFSEVIALDESIYKAI